MTDEELQSNRTHMYEDLITNKLITDDNYIFKDTALRVVLMTLLN